MESFAILTIVISPALCLVCFAALPPPRAILISSIALYLFLPQVLVSIFGMLEYRKEVWINITVFLCALAFDYRTLFKFRPRWFDFPVLLFCLAQAAASLVNELGYYDALSTLKNSTFTWIFPYFLGRAYFQSSAHLRDIAFAIYLGGVAYVLPCLYEIRMSPQLHAIVYSVHQHSFAQTVRFDGYRPTAFLAHGLMVGMWMTSASLSGIWLWATGCFKKYPASYFSHGLVVSLLFVTTILCKSTGAIFLLALGLVILFAARYFNSRMIMLVTLSLIPAYLILRSLNIWSGAELVDVSNQISAGRGQSLEFRLYMENILVEKALQQPLFGWGGWGRSRVYDAESGQDICITDGAWIIILGSSGVIGLASWLAFSTVPQFRFLAIHPASSWSDPIVAPAAILSVILTLFLIDCLPNSMLMPIYPLCAGALGSFSLQPSSSDAEIAPSSLMNTYRKTRTSRRLWPFYDPILNNSFIESHTTS